MVMFSLFNIYRLLSNAALTRRFWRVAVERQLFLLGHRTQLLIVSYRGRRKIEDVIFTFCAFFLISSINSSEYFP